MSDSRQGDGERSPLYAQEAHRAQRSRKSRSAKIAQNWVLQKSQEKAIMIHEPKRWCQTHAIKIVTCAGTVPPIASHAVTSDESRCMRNYESGSETTSCPRPCVGLVWAYTL